MVQLWSSFFLVSLPILATAFNTTVHGQVISKRAASNWPIKSGYVAFGDSFAAGMGTGATTTDACRVGTNNLGDLINRYTNNGDVDFQQRACSGDTTVGLNRQIDKWQKPELADVATISMGGNDLHFSDLIWYCVITPFPSKQDEALCDQQITWAKGNMTDTSDNSLAARLQAAYKRVLDKSGGLVCLQLFFVNNRPTDV
jgi:lysophospholipase L1-like esterase